MYSSGMEENLGKFPIYIFHYHISVTLYEVTKILTQALQSHGGIAVKTRTLYFIKQLIESAPPNHVMVTITLYIVYIYICIYIYSLKLG